MYVKFNDSKRTVSCTVKPVSENVVELKFSGNITVDTSGFKAYLDSACEYLIGDYSGYTTIYRNDETTAETNSYQLSNDGSVYVESVAEESTPEPALTAEQSEEQERQNKITSLQSQITGLKSQIAETDYIFTKAYELSLIGEISTEYDFSQLHVERQALRDEINALELELNLLMEESEE